MKPISFNQPHSDDDQVLLLNTIKALAPFKNLRGTMPLQYVTAFLLVASEESLNVSEYAKRAGTSQSLMSRHIADLSEVNRHHKPGFGLLEQFGDIVDRRNRLIRLTTKGKGIVEQMVRAHKTGSMNNLKK